MTGIVPDSISHNKMSQCRLCSGIPQDMEEVVHGIADPWIRGPV